jgi:aspartate kinase
MSVKVCKFGGSSLADANQFRKVRDIIERDPARRVIVVSAPGKRSADDHKITDMLLVCQDLAEKEFDIEPVFSRIRERFTTIVSDLSLDLNIEELLDNTARKIQHNPSKDFVSSRGEYLNGHVMAAFLDATYIEPQDSIFLQEGTTVNPATYDRIAEQISDTGLYVIPGFYGINERGRITTFSRGGSDITGAIAARAITAAVYENWTDVSGFLMADPRIVDSPKHIELLTYKELRELAYMGANVLHDESIFPIRDVGIPIEIRNTNAPDGPVTMIVAAREADDRIITGIAGRKDFVLVQIEKTLMNKMIGFGRRILQIFESYGISYDHTPTGIDTMSVVLREEHFAEHESAIINEIKRVLEPDNIVITRDLAIIATVGQGMIRCIGFAGRLCTVLADNGINLHIIDLGSSEDNMIVGIDNKHYETAINAIYHEFV